MYQNNHIRVVPVTEGMKIFMPNKESCLTLERKLNHTGIRTRAGRNREIDLWGIYIISIPEPLKKDLYMKDDIIYTEE
jgi:hypothetical protein